MWTPKDCEFGPDGAILRHSEHAVPAKLEILGPNTVGVRLSWEVTWITVVRAGSFRGVRSERI